jgi:hypothetical protein
MKRYQLLSLLWFKEYLSRYWLELEKLFSLLTWYFYFLLCWYIANRESICNESSRYNHTWWITLSIRGRTTLHLIVVEVLLLFVLILKLGSMETREPHWMATGCCLSSLNLIWISGIDKWKEDGDSYYGHQTSLDPSFAILKGLLLFWS